MGARIGTGRLVEVGGAATLYGAFFAALFVPFALRGELPGNCDTWLAIALSNHYAREAHGWLTGMFSGSAMYPFGPVFAYGESSPLGAAVFLLAKTLGLGDLGAWAFFLVVGQAGGALAIHALARTLGCGLPGALYAGFAFTCSNFAFANLDDAIVAIYLLPALCLRELFLAGDRAGRLGRAGLWGGLQAYLSVYVFLYQCVAIAAAAPFLRLHARQWIRFALPYAGIAAPVFAIYLAVYLRLDLVTELAGKAQSLTEYRSLDLAELWAPLPGNLLYASEPLPTGIPFWLELRQRAFLGFGVVALAALGVVKRAPGRGFASLLVALGLVLSWGAPLELGAWTIPAPLYALYEVSDLAAIVRLPFRAYFLTSLGLALLAARGVDRLLSGLPEGLLRGAVCAGLLAVHALENVPARLPTFAAEPYLDAPSGYRRFFAAQAERVVLDLPSRGFGIELFQDADRPLFAYNREVIFMNWQTQHRQNVLGGLHGYLTRERKAVYEAIHAVPAPEALARLSELGLEYIVFHVQLVLSGEEDLASELASSPALEEVHRDDEVVVYALVGSGS